MSRSATRQNEYFVPREGIDREVISADICRYLGNDALVRPGYYDNPHTGQSIPGYYITAYRNLTTAMIEDLKTNSLQWDMERRAQTARNSNTVQYRSSETHQTRQQQGPTDPPYREDPYTRDPPNEHTRYPGTGPPGYTGATGSYAPLQQGYGPLPPSGGGGGGSSGAGAYGGGGGGGPGSYAQSQQSPGLQDARYVPPHGGPPVMGQGYQSPDQPYVSTGANMPPRVYPVNDPYASSRPGPPVSGPPHPVYATGAPPPPTSQPGYPSPAYPYSNPPSSGAPPYNTLQQQPQDPFFGRGASASSNGYSSFAPPDVKPSSDFAVSPGQTSQPPPPVYPVQGYEGTPPPTRSSITPADNQTPPRDSSHRLGDRRR